MADRIAAVTGANGFLGRHVVRALSERGWRVRALVRRRREPVPWDGPSPDIIEGGLEDEEVLGRLVANTDTVVHLAGVVAAPIRSDFHRVNSEGTHRLARIMASRAPAARLVLVSSLAAREPHLSAYAASKLAGETAATGVLGFDRVTIMRPTAIYGPGDPQTLLLFKTAASSPLMMHPDVGSARLTLVHAGDAAIATVHFAERRSSGVFAIAGAQPGGYSWRQVMETACAAVGGRPGLFPTPPWLIRGAAGLFTAAGRAGLAPPILNSDKAREMLHPDWSVSPAELGPDPAPVRFELADGFADSVAWYRKQGLLPDKATRSASRA